MGGYEDVLRASSHCVHFIYSAHTEAQLEAVAGIVKRAGIKVAYLDCSQIGTGNSNIIDSIAEFLKLENFPYGVRTSQHQPEAWVPFLDDLITLSYQESGLVILLDCADSLFEKSNREMFMLIEIFLIQFHHWFEKSKPCHLYFQMYR
jgi:hypothetical protein